MEIFIIILTSIAIWHFIYENMIRPNIQLQLKHKLFIERDRLRNLELENQLNDIDIVAIKNIDENINMMIDRMSEITLYDAVQIQQLYNSDADIRAEIDVLEEKIKASKNLTIEKVDNSLTQIATRGILSNSGGWLIYLVPIAIVQSSIKKINQLSRDLTIISDNKYENINTRRIA